MDPNAAFTSQYHAALETLRRTIEKCPAELWTSDACKNAFWRVVFHTLYFTDVYLCENEAAYRPWSGFGGEVRTFDPLSLKNYTGAPPTQAELLGYLAHLSEVTPQRVDAVPLDAPSGFSWNSLIRFELHIYNIRHIQHHAAQLSARLREKAGIEIDWVGKWPNS